MMVEPVPLQRAAIARQHAAAQDANPGLVLQRGWPAACDGDGAGSKAWHLQRIAMSGVCPAYQHAFARWQAATADRERFFQCEARLQNRLMIGLSGGAALETGCTLGHTWGMPMIPGSSLKGAVRSHAEQLFGAGNPLVVEMFGAREGDPLSGVVAFHDAWWVPDRQTPLVSDIVTVHHPDYYSGQGRAPASDMDSPIPVPLLAVQGAFLFVIEGPQNWAALAGNWLLSTLVERGIGAKTNAGYGYFVAPKPPAAHEVWESAKLVFDPGRKEIHAQCSGQKTAPLRADRVEGFFAALDPELAARLRKKKLDGVGGLRVEVERESELLVHLLRVIP